MHEDKEARSRCGGVQTQKLLGGKVALSRGVGTAQRTLMPVGACHDEPKCGNGASAVDPVRYGVKFRGSSVMQENSVMVAAIVSALR